ncbi:hypothetical protein SPHINGOAX6_50200 [Sphingomonas sp. AX6]|nr:hypothetical protein SPHINGOAX6_50200 [Sphingomonas sp. AX6]
MANAGEWTATARSAVRVTRGLRVELIERPERKLRPYLLVLTETPFVPSEVEGHVRAKRERKKRPRLRSAKPIDFARDERVRWRYSESPSVCPE